MRPKFRICYRHYLWRSWLLTYNDVILFHHADPEVVFDSFRALLYLRSLNI